MVSRRNRKSVRDNLYKNITGGGGDNISIGERFRDRGFTNGMVDEFRVFDRELTEIEVKTIFDSKSLSEQIAAVTERRTGDLKDYQSNLYAYFLSTQKRAIQERSGRSNKRLANRTTIWSTAFKKS